jgi:hypothetical protein
MDIKKTVNYLSYIGVLLFVGCFVASLIMYGTIHGFQHNMAIKCTMLVAFFLVILKWIYQLCHWNEYRKENITNIIFIIFMLVLVSIALMIR